MLRSVKATTFEEEESVHLWTEIWEEEKDTRAKRKQHAKETDVWKEVDLEQETMENLFKDGERFYKDAEEYEG